MIVADRKAFTEIQEKLKPFKRVLVLGCGTCVSVCMAGGEKEVELLASELRIADGLNGHGQKIGEATIQRQCDREYIEPIIRTAADYDAVLSLACGAGVQLVADVLEPKPVIPGLNTRFIGITEAEGKWAERCLACGNCVAGDFGGICPITLCAKSLINGPCGGSKLGKCEAEATRDCAWVLIYNRLKKQGRLDILREFVVPRDNAKPHPSRRIAEAYLRPELEKVATEAKSN